ncbi:MAG: hypothetical protein AAF597_18970 [Bacteroidota bacterium]
MVLFYQFSKSGGYTKAGRSWRAVAAIVVVTLVLSLSLQTTIGIFAGYRNAAQGKAEQLEQILAE